MTIITPKAQEHNNEEIPAKKEGLLNAYKSKEEIEKLYLDKDSIKIDGGEVRILNDDEIIATISNPEDILHTY